MNDQGDLNHPGEKKSGLYAGNAEKDFLARRYSEDFSIPLEIALIVADRYPEYRAAKDYVFPDLTQLADPSMLPDIEEAGDMLAGAVKRQEGILIYCHDDADGYTAAALIYKTLADLCRGGVKDRVFVYPLDRERDGYLVNPSVLRSYRDRGVSLVVTVDFGVSSVANIRTAAELGMDFVICDHHETMSSEFPVPVVDPKRPDSKYPFRELAGAGVSLKLCQYLYGRMLGLTGREFFKLKQEFLAIAMIGTVADRVKMTGESRVICHEGLNAFNRIGDPWAISLRQGSDAGFPAVIAGVLPVLAAAATTEANQAIMLFLAKTTADAGSIISSLRGHEDARRAEIDRIFDLAMAAAKSYPRIVISVIGEAPMHFLGAASARLRDSFQRVSCLISRKQGKYVGEMRTTGVDLYRMLNEMRDLFSDYGGHARAAGFSMSGDRIDDFLDRADRYTQARSEDPVPSKRPALKLDKSRVSILAPLMPFGEGNPAPLLTDGIDMYTIDNRLKIIYQGTCQT